MIPRSALILLVLCLGPPTAASAADIEQLEEVIVTARFREHRLMNSVGSISVITDEVLRERGAQHLEDVLSAAPNVSWSTGASRSRFIQMRGVGDLEQYAEPKYYPSVGIVLDDLELGSAANAGMLFDVAQIEILRGPQGTRFGASAHAGMINIISNAPTDEFEAVLSGGAGNYDSYNLGAVLSGPLANTLSARASVQLNREDGYVDNDYSNKDDSNEFDELTARLRLRWQPTQSSQYDLNTFYFDADNGYDTYSLDNNRTTQSDQPGEDDQESLGLSAHGQWQLNGSTSLRAVVSHLDSELLYSYDVDWVSQDYCVTFSCSGGVDTAMEIFDRDRQQTTLDIRLLGGAGSLSAGEWRYVAGFYANSSEEDLDYAYPSLWYGDYANSSSYETDRYAVYGELEVAISDRLTLSTSARIEYFDDSYDDSNEVSHGDDEDLWNGELVAEYDLSDSSLLYASLAVANKPGGVNVSASSQYSIMSPDFQGFMESKLRFEEETLSTAELGIKTRQLNQRLSLRAAVFYATRDSAQLENWMWDDATGLWIGYLDSTGDADNYGAELESTFMLNDSIQLFANLGWLKTEIDTITTFDLDEFAFVSKNNREQSKSPEYQFNAGIRAAITEQLSGVIEVEGRDDSYYGYYHDGELESYELLNANLSWTNERFEISLWGRNLTDENYATHGLYFGADPRDDFGAWGNQTYQQLGAPRTYGVNVSYRM